MYIQSKPTSMEMFQAGQGKDTVPLISQLTNVNIAQFHLLARDGVLALVGADFIETKSPNLMEIMKLSSSTKVTLLLLPKFPAQFPSLDSIREEATSLSIEIHYFALDVPEKYDEIVEKLDEYASGETWLVIEYCHLMPNYPDVLDIMNEVCSSFWFMLSQKNNQKLLQCLF